MVSGVRDDDFAGGVRCHVPGVVEVTGVGAFLAEFEEKVAGEGENLDAMVVLVGDDDSTTLVDGDAGGSIELLGTSAVGADSTDDAAVLAEDEDAIVGSVGDVDVVVLVAGDAPGSAEIVGILRFDGVLADDFYWRWIEDGGVGLLAPDDDSVGT